MAQGGHGLRRPHADRRRGLRLGRRQGRLRGPFLHPRWGDRLRMTYDARETSLDSGEPIELFKFVAGGQTFTYTSCDQEQVLASETYTPAAIHRSAVELDGETTKGAIEVSVPRTNPLAAFFIGYAPEPAI